MPEMSKMPEILANVLNPWTLGALTIWVVLTILGWALDWLDRQTAPLERKR